MGAAQSGLPAVRGPIPPGKSVVLPMVLKNRVFWRRSGRLLSGSCANQARFPSPDTIDRRRTRLFCRGLAMHRLNIWCCA